MLKVLAHRRDGEEESRRDGDVVIDVTVVSLVGVVVSDRTIPRAPAAFDNRCLVVAAGHCRRDDEA